MRLSTTRILLLYATFVTAGITVILYMILNTNSGSSPGRIRRGRGRYRGSNGQHAFYQAAQRDWEVDPELVRALCRDTNLTQCNPRPRRSDSERAADRAARKPFNVVDYVRFPHLPEDPSFEGCDYDNCQYKGHAVTLETDAVFVYGVGLTDQSTPLPEVRLPYQTFIFASWEPPVFGWSDVLTDQKSQWAQVFNATMNYKIDAQVSYPYGKLDFQPRRKDQLPDYLSIARRKTRTAVWFVSNCGPNPSYRMDYVREMQKYIDVDIFGGCGEACELNNEKCIRDFSTTYKFYLAFEKCFCTDYVTEKFFKVFADDSHVIPVVRGGVDYNREFPEKSFVNAADFKSPEELATFLKTLGENEEEYSRYLEVKDRYRAITYGNRWCYLCEYLHKRPALRSGLNVQKSYGQGLWKPDKTKT